jgi:hypothetical protein
MPTDPERRRRIGMACLIAAIAIIVVHSFLQEGPGIRVEVLGLPILVIIGGALIGIGLSLRRPPSPS